MKNNSETKLIAIKDNKDIVNALKKGKRLNLPFATLWVVKDNDKSSIYYALLVNKSQFKLAVTRNKVKRQLRDILIKSNLNGGIKVLIKPNAIYLKKEYSEISQAILKILNK